MIGDDYCNDGDRVRPCRDRDKVAFQYTQFRLSVRRLRVGEL